MALHTFPASLPCFFSPQDLTNRLVEVQIHIVWICSMWGGRTEELRLKIKGTDDVLTDEISQQLWHSVLGEAVGGVLCRTDRIPILR